MSKKYSVTGSNNSQAAPATLINIIGSTTIRPQVFDVIVGNCVTPADQAADMVLARTTAVGTAGSNPAPLSTDLGDSAAICTAAIAHSAEPTYGATFLLEFGMNQRATFRWVAAPDSGFFGALTASNGIGLKIHTSSATLVIRGTVLFAE